MRNALRDLAIDPGARWLTFEPLSVPFAKSTNAVRVQRYLASRQNLDGFVSPFRNLGLRIIESQRIDLVIEQVDANWRAGAHRENVD